MGLTKTSEIVEINKQIELMKMKKMFEAFFQFVMMVINENEDP